MISWVCIGIVWFWVQGANGSPDRAFDVSAESRAPERTVAPVTTHSNLTRLADSVLEIWPSPETWAWSWGQGVMSYGLLRATAVTGDRKYADHVQRFLDAHIDSSGRLSEWPLFPDRVAPSIATFGMLRLTGDPRYAEVCDFLAEWLMNEAPRSRDGGWFHLPLLDAQWVDTLFMTTVFLAAYGDYVGREDYTHEALRQHELLAGNLYSVEDQLYWHAWDQDGLLSPWATPWRHHSTAFWARGNGWAVSSLARVLSRSDPAWVEYAPARERLEATLGRLWGLQDVQSGHWWTVLDEPGRPFNYTETTATALIVEASIRAARFDLTLEPDRAGVRAGLAAIQERLVEDGQGRTRVVGASIGTNPSGYWGYALIPTWPDRMWGIGAVLMLLSELSEVSG